MQNIVEMFDKIYNVDQEKIDKMSRIDIAPGGKLPLPEKGESMTVFAIAAPTLVTLPDGKKFGNIRIKLYNSKQDVPFDWNLSKTAWMGIRKEFARLKMQIDQEMKCLIGVPITITGKDWNTAPSEIWQTDPITGKKVSPKTYNINIREDLMEANKNKANEGTTGLDKPDLMSF